ncbi:MAG: ABC transporter permease [Armatimonadota bacterium]|nr:ABC transporter permease [Armatimonadota bacterium]MDR7426555.1 ABC transporter permease [Armatimonadota bacterium]MDR7464240.1 ABC transporter permease [Armatimonadota bacterium]MDR7470835.1 ABC transporter permease [Armatimonadota bacterium]MDR7474533.1 ABC transporter permease [Armatimonadota bacterium]
MTIRATAQTYVPTEVVFDQRGQAVKRVTFGGVVSAGLMVVNTVYLHLMERIREFGVIMAWAPAGALWPSWCCGRAYGCV